MPLRVERLPPEKECCLLDKAYGVDKSQPGESPKHTLRNKLKMGNSHCCDYIVPEDSRVILVEDSNLKIKKQSGYSMEDIKEEQSKKANSSLILLNCLIQKCKKAKDLMEDKQVSFWLIINDLSIKDTEAPIFIDSIKGSLVDLLGPKIPVEVLPLRQAKTKFESVKPIMA